MKDYKMDKAKVFIKYRYLGDKLGAIPHIYIEYIDRDGKSLDPLEALYLRTDSHIVPHTHFFSGKTTDGEEFKVEKHEDVPQNVVYPYYEHSSEIRPIDDYLLDDIETIMKKLATEFIANGIDAEFCARDEKNSSYYGGTTDDLKKSEFNNALVSGITLNHQIKLNPNLSIGDKCLLISKIFMGMFERVQTNKIGFATDDKYPSSKITFEIDGLNLELLKSLPNLEKVVYEIMINHIIQTNQKFKTETQEPNNKSR